MIYYYNSGAGTGRIRAVDAFTGTLLWSIEKAGVRGLVAADDSLLVLLQDQVEVYRATFEIYFAHLADGGGQTTLLTLNNLSAQTANGTAQFTGSDGNPLVVSVDGIAAPVSQVVFNIPPAGSISIQTLGDSAVGLPGWARVESDQPITGSSIFQFSNANGTILFEAGVGDAVAIGRANLFVSLLSGAQPATFFSTGVAVANPSGETATITLRLFQNGNEIASQTLTLDPNEQLPRFIDQLFPQQLGGVAQFEGTLVIESNIPVVITALRTQGGLQMSSFPVGQVVR